MGRLLAAQPKARVLLMSANILYGRNLTHELIEGGFDAAFYKDKHANLANHQVVVCSLESLQRLEVFVLVVCARYATS